MEKDELLKTEENQIPGQENEVGAETGTAEGGEVNEATTVDKPEEENVTNEDVVTEENVNDDNQESEPELESEAEDESNEEPEPELEPEPEQEKMLTQSQVNELVGKARQEGRLSAMKELYERYGVNDDNEMNDIFGKGQGYDVLNDEYTSLNGKYGDVAAENALLKSGVVANRWSDVKAILGSKGMDITVDNIQSEMATHPEWQNNAAVTSAEPEAKQLSPEMAEQFAEGVKPGKAVPARTSTIRKLGSNAPETKIDTEENDVMKMFGLK